MRFALLYVLGGVALVFFPPTTSDFIWAIPLILLGLAIRGWGAGHLVKNERLTVTGPYAYLRHPLYAGTLLVATGFAVLVGGRVSLILIAVLWPWFGLDYFPRKDRVESARLEARYGEDYRVYHASVPALWPRCRAWTCSGPGDVAQPASRGWHGDRYSENNELGTMLAVLSGLLLFWLRAQWAAT